MAKKKVIIGSIIKGRKNDITGEVKPDYIKVNGEHVLRDGMFLNLETKQSQLASLEQAVQSGKLQESTAAQIREKINKIPDFVRFQITTLVEK